MRRGGSERTGPERPGVPPQAFMLGGDLAFLVERGDMSVGEVSTGGGNVLHPQAPRPGGDPTCLMEVDTEEVTVEVCLSPASRREPQSPCQLTHVVNADATLQCRWPRRWWCSRLGPQPRLMPRLSGRSPEPTVTPLSLLRRRPETR